MTSATLEDAEKWRAEALALRTLVAQLRMDLIGIAEEAELSRRRADRELAKLTRCLHGDTRDQVEASARLIAAAPDLAASIMNSDSAHWTTAMRAALNKAGFNP